MSLRILVATPDPEIRETLEVRLVGAGFEPFCAPDAHSAADLGTRLGAEIWLWGLFEAEERARVSEIARRCPDAYWVATGPGAPGLALETGMDDALENPGHEPALELVMRRAARACAARRDRRLLARRLADAAPERPIVGASPAMIELLEAMEAAAGFSACVLLRGEAGTGKEGIARAIHAQSARRQGPFVRVGARDGDAEGLARELFGACDPAGSPPGGLVEAGGGTLFLDDVEALPEDVQERLLGVLESEEVTPCGGEKPRRIDVRLIAASRCDLRAAVRAGEFHEGLLERLAAVELAVPALRERSRDIPLLLDHFVERAGRQLGRTLRGLSDDALARLVDYAWPGNIRELESVALRAVALARGEQITLRELPEHLDPDPEQRDGDLGLRRGRKRLEAEMIRRALQRTGGNRTRAARLLEISHRALLYKLKEYGIRD
ncbi:MAG: sigma 54-interacting transcriptional regulator [Myxococcota bacterium]